MVILGPTAVGKTELSICLAQRLEGEIVSADTRLFYRGMDIGTAKPTLEERQLVRHHLIDVADPDEIWSLALFQQRAQAVIAEMHSRRCLPILVGGSGQYIQAVIQGWQVPAYKPDYRMREVLERLAAEIGGEELHRRLAVVDAQAAAEIDHRNLRRTIRALEVIFHSGRRFSAQKKRRPSPYSLLVIGLKRPRPELYARVDARIEAMIRSGLVDEARALLERGYTPDLPTLSAIGYREMIAYLQGQMSMEEAVILMKRMTRQFVRRQANWFKEDDPAIRWFDAGRTSPEEIIEFARSAQNWTPAN